MAKYTGVTQNKDGSWTYRLKIKLPNGKVIDTRIKKDERGNPFLTARAAHEARKEHEASIRANPEDHSSKRQEITLADVYENYMKTEAKDKAPATLRKQNSMWENHVSKKFGSCPVNSITIIDLSIYLQELYREYSYMYVQGFLRFFYLLFGHADRMEVIEPTRYMRMFVARGTRLEMPKMTQADYEESEEGARVYSDPEIKTIEKIFMSEDGNLLTAFYIGLYCGLRISECFALRWESIDWENRLITVNRQMHYEDGIIKLCAVKTLTSVRKVVIPDFLLDHLDSWYHDQHRFKCAYGNGYRDTERVYDEVKDIWIIGGDFINRKKNGELLTVNSMKYWAKKIKAEAQIDFHFHDLRHTYATTCAINNVNMQMLMTMLGHKKLDTTRKYYIDTDNETLHKRTMAILNSMYIYQSATEYFPKEKPIYTTIDSKNRRTNFTKEAPKGEEYSSRAVLDTPEDPESLARLTRDISIRNQRKTQRKNTLAQSQKTERAKSQHAKKSAYTEKRLLERNSKEAIAERHSQQLAEYREKREAELKALEEKMEKSTAT